MRNRKVTGASAERCGGSDDHVAADQHMLAAAVIERSSLRDGGPELKAALAGAS